MELFRDLRFASRLLVKDRWFTLMAIVVLALGLAANNTVFTIVNAILLRNLPLPHPSQIMWVGTRTHRDATSASLYETSRTGGPPPARSPG